MKFIKLLTVAAVAVAFSVGVALAADAPKEVRKGSCCDKAGGADKCEHKCCKEAAAKKEICAKCNAPKKKDS